MPSSEDKDSKSTTQPERDDNPFVKFRRFADSQISSVLQGIIGLPSAFKTHNENTRWGELDERLKRRDEKVSEEREKKVANVDDPEMRYSYSYQVPIGAFGGRAQKDTTSGLDGRDDADIPRSEGIEYDDIPLYSSFEELAKIGPNLVNGSSYGVSFRWIDYYEARPIQYMNTLQSRLCKQLDSRWFCRDEFDLDRFWYGKRGSKSLLPFLLLSCNYSPLALTHMPRLRARGPGIAPEGLPDDEFSYCDAFEDLLLASRGRPMRTWSVQGIRSISDIFFRSPDSLYPDLRFLRFPTARDNGPHASYLGFSWLKSALHNQGLLWESPEKGDRFEYPSVKEGFEAYPLRFRPVIEPKQASPATSNENAEDGPKTEQEMYNRFLDLATTAFNKKSFADPDLDKFVTDAKKLMTKLVAEIEKEISTPIPREVPSTTESKAISSGSETPDFPGKSDTVRVFEMLDALCSIFEEPSPPLPSAFDKQPDLPASKLDSSTARWSTTSESTTTTRPDSTSYTSYGLISSETTTTSQDGTTHTTTVIRKQLPDGRVLRSQTDTVSDNGQIVDSVTVEEEERVSGEDTWEDEWDSDEWETTQQTVKQEDKAPIDKRTSQDEFMGFGRKGREKDREGRPGWFWDSEKKRR